jgi:hypothetical protein
LEKVDRLLDFDLFLRLQVPLHRLLERRDDAAVANFNGGGNGRATHTGIRVIQLGRNRV